MALFGKKPQPDIKKHWEKYFSSLIKQDVKKALSALNDLRELEPENAQLHIKHGDLLQKTGDAATAVASYHRAASLLIANGFELKALAIYKLILRLSPNDPEANSTTQDILMRLESRKSEPAATPDDASEPDPMFPTYAEETGDAGGGFDEAPVTGLSGAWPDQEQGGDEEPRQAQVPDGHEEWPSSEGRAELEAPEEPPKSFLSLSPEEAGEITGRAETRTFHDGDTVVEEGDAGDSMFFIKSGRAKVIMHIMGKTIHLATLSAGDVFGEVAFLTGRPRTASVIANGDLTVLDIDRLILQEAIEKNPRITDKLMEFYHSRVRDTIRKVKGGG